MSAKTNIFVGTPCYGSWLSEDYFHSILDLQNLCRQEGISLRVQTLGQESLVTRARNTLVANFLDDKDDLFGKTNNLTEFPLNRLENQFHEFPSQNDQCLDAF